jgi:membrane fusion protein, heavy metal efflux system
MATAARRMRIKGRYRLAAAAAVLLLAACGGKPAGTGAASREPLALTHVSEGSELFVEFRPLVSGEPSVFAAHFTRLQDYRPVTEGTLDVVLSGGAAPPERFRIRAPRAPGIFAPTVVPRATGPRTVELLLESPGFSARHQLGNFEVYADVAAAAAAPQRRSAEGEIGFLKEQQWSSDFMVETLAPQAIRDSVAAPARVRAAASGEFQLHAPLAGRYSAAAEVPVVGAEVAAGQVLGSLIPRLGTDTDQATLQAALRSAEAEAALARQEFTRLQELLSIQAVADRRVDEARAALQVAQARLDAARQRALPDARAGGIALRAPIAGVLAEVRVAQGAAVEDGALLFHIVDRSTLWIEAQVAESDVGRLRTPAGLAFEVAGLADPVEIVPGQNGALVGVGSVIDPQSRSLPVVFALHDPPAGLAINQRGTARILTGDARQALSVPTSALIEDGGQRVVYLMRGGESFSRVPVKAGTRDGERVEIVEGLSPGDRVVTRGAMLVRLAAATPEAMGHGHAH